LAAVISNEESLTTFLPTLRAAPWIAIDTEADSLHAYPEKLCLLQISIPGHDRLVDPLAGFSIAPLFPIFHEHELIMHGSDYDLRLFKRGFDFVPTRIFDTMIAARLLGYREFSLTVLVANKLGVTLEKGPQKMDWARRPLTARMEAYARNDTHYLHPLAEQLRSELVARGRLTWQEQSCAQLIAEASQARKPDPETIWRIKGSDRLSPRALAILREIFYWREEQAVELNKPPFFVLSHDHLVGLAAAVANQPNDDSVVPKRMSPKRRERLLAALRRGLDLPTEHCPGPRRFVSHRLTRAQQRIFEELRDRRDRRAEELGIDPTIIASRGNLVGLARDWQVGQEELVAWQCDLLKG
jgi:ribonuclease D